MFKNTTCAIQITIATVSMLLVAGGVFFLFWGPTMTGDPTFFVSAGWMLIFLGIVTFVIGQFCAMQSIRGGSGW